MARFLSKDWLGELCRALEGSSETQTSLADVVLTVQQHVAGAPDGDVAYWTSFDHGAVTGDLGETSGADVTLAMDHATAVALSRSELNHQAAFMQGRLTVTGNMGKLLVHQEALAMLGPAMASLATDY